MHSRFRILQSSNTHTREQTASNNTEHYLKMTSNYLKTTSNDLKDTSKDSAINK